MTSPPLGHPQLCEEYFLHMDTSPLVNSYAEIPTLEFSNDSAPLSLIPENGKSYDIKVIIFHRLPIE